MFTVIQTVHLLVPFLQWCQMTRYSKIFTKLNERCVTTSLKAEMSDPLMSLVSCICCWVCLGLESLVNWFHLCFLSTGQYLYLRVESSAFLQPSSHHKSKPSLCHSILKWAPCFCTTALGLMFCVSRPGFITKCVVTEVVFWTYCRSLYHLDHGKCWRINLNPGHVKTCILTGLSLLLCSMLEPIPAVTQARVCVQSTTGSHTVCHSLSLTFQPT